MMGTIHGMITSAKETAHFGYLFANSIKLIQHLPGDTVKQYAQAENTTASSGIEVVYLACFGIYFALHIASLICKHVHRKPR